MNIIINDKDHWALETDETLPSEITVSSPMYTAYVPKNDAPTDTRSNEGVTFDEMYGERCLLWVSLVTLYQHEGGRTFKSDTDILGRHVPGWFILGIETMHGSVGLMVHNSYWDKMDNVPTLKLAPIMWPDDEHYIQMIIHDVERFIIDGKGYLNGDKTDRLKWMG